MSEQHTPVPPTPAERDAAVNAAALARQQGIESDDARREREAREALAPRQPDPNAGPEAVKVGDVLSNGTIVKAINEMSVLVECPAGTTLQGSRLVPYRPGPFDPDPAPVVLTMAQAEALKTRG